MITYSRAIITALEEAIAYPGISKTNAPAPALWLDKKAYIGEIKALVIELKRINKAKKLSKKFVN